MVPSGNGEVVEVAEAGVGAEGEAAVSSGQSGEAEEGHVSGSLGRSRGLWRGTEGG